MTKWKTKIDARLSPGRVSALLFELCVKYGYCEAGRSVDQLAENPPTTIDSFLNEGVRLEGVDPRACDHRNKLRAIVEKYFAAEVESASARH